MASVKMLRCSNYQTQTTRLTHFFKIECRDLRIDNLTKLWTQVLFSKNETPDKSSDYLGKQLSPH